MTHSLSTSKTTSTTSNGSASSRHQPTRLSISANLKPETPDAAPTTSSLPSPPQLQGSDSLYVLGIQAQDIAGEIALASELLASDDPEEQQAAVQLIEHFLEAAEHHHSLLMEKSDKIAYYIDVLRAQSEFRKQQAKRLAELAADDARRADKLLSYMTGVLGRLEPDKTKYSLPTHELTSRVSTSVEIIDEDLIPDDLFTVKVVKTPNKTAIKKAIETGKPVLGAELNTKRNWSIK